MHNRWHPAIKPAIRIASGDSVEMQTRDASDGQVLRSTGPGDLMSLQLGRIHPLTGPVYVEGAEPGDLLAVHIEEIVASDHGFTATFPGRGLMPDLFPGPLLVHWDIHDGWATSGGLPGIRVPGAPFMGTIGVAPSMERLRSVNLREQAALASGAMVMPPRRDGAIPADPTIADEAWRTAAAHEVGGNMDIKQLIKGTTVYFPVDVAGALFSAGDAHFAQGDGETCGTAIEMGARLTARFEVLKGEATRRKQTNPTFSMPAMGVDVVASRGYFATTALSIKDSGAVSPLDINQAARNAVRMMVDAIAHDHGMSREQAYLVASVAGDLRISSIVNIPHAQVSMLMPKAIFES